MIYIIRNFFRRESSSHMGQICDTSRVHPRQLLPCKERIWNTDHRLEHLVRTMSKIEIYLAAPLFKIPYLLHLFRPELCLVNTASVYILNIAVYRMRIWHCPSSRDKRTRFNIKATA